MFLQKSNILKTNIFICLVYAILPFIFYYNSFIVNGFWSGGEGWAWNMPIKYLMVDKILNGTSILWNGYSNAGYPFLADLQAAVLYPLNVVFFILPIKTAYNYAIFLHFSLAGFFTFLYLRQIKLSLPAAFAGGVVFMFCPTLDLRYVHFILLATITWFPLILFFVEKKITTNDNKYSLYAALAIAIQVFAGFIQVAIYSSIAVFIYCLARIFTQSTVQGSSKLKTKLNHSIKILFPIGVIALSVSLVQILPTYELVKFVGKDDTSYEYFSGLSLSWKFLLTYFVPFLYGDWGIIFKPFVSFFVEEQQPASSDLYISITAFVFSLYALKFFKSEKLVKVWTIMVLTGLIMALGKNIPIVSHLLYRIPFYGSFRVPCRSIFVLTFSMVVLFAFAFDRVFSNFDNIQYKKILRFFLGVSAIVLFLVVSFVVFSGPFIEKFYDSIGNPLINNNKTDVVRQYYSFTNLALYTSLIAISLVCLTLSIFRKHPGISMLILVLIITMDIWIYSYGFSRGGYVNNPETYRIAKKINEIKDPLDRVWGVMPDNNYVIKAYMATGIVPDISFLAKIPTINNYETFLKQSYKSMLGEHDGGVTENYEEVLSGNDFISMLGTKYIVAHKDLAPKIDAVLDINEAKLIKQIVNPTISYAVGGDGRWIYSQKVKLKKNTDYRVKLEIKNVNKNGQFVDLNGKDYTMLISGLDDKKDSKVFYTYINTGDKMPDDIDFRVVGYDNLQVVQAIIEEIVYSGKPLYSRLFEMDDHIVYLNPKARKRIFSVTDVKFKNIFTNLPEDMAKTAVIEGNNIKFGDLSEVKINKIDYKDGLLTANVNCESKCFVMFSENYYPGWKVYKNGKEENLYIVNDIVMGAFIEKGDRTIKFVYSPNSFKIGFMLSILGLVGGIIWAFFIRKRIY